MGRVILILAAVAVVEDWLLMSALDFEPLWAFGTVIATLALIVALLILRASKAPSD